MPYRDFGLKGASTHTTDAFAANIVSLLQAGCFFGALIAAPLGDKLGRRITLMITGVIFSAGSLCQVLSSGSTPAMFAGRAIGGLVSNIILSFEGHFFMSVFRVLAVQACLSPCTSLRFHHRPFEAALSAFMRWASRLERALVSGSTTGIKKHVAPTSAQWRIPFAIQLIPGGLLVLGMIFLPESPRWIARFKGREEAVAVFSKLRNLPEDHEYVTEDIYRVMDQIEQERLATHGKGLIAEFREMAMPGNRSRITIGVLIFVFMQMAGSNAINVSIS
jgi:MFS family permease